MEIRDSQVLITGANRGIGRAVAMMCAEDKAHLHLVMRKKDPELSEELIKAGAASVHIYEVDLCQRKQIDQFLKNIQNEKIDILFNNAGQLDGGQLETEKVDDIYNLLQVNVNAVIHLTRGILPGMLERKRGKIINHSSIAGVMHFPGSSVYSASKAAVLAFTNSLRAELAPTPITTLVLITPGVDTRMYNDIPKFFGANFNWTLTKGLPPKKYSKMIREAILEDLTVLKPSGLTGAGVLMAHHLPKVFENFVRTRFKRL